MRLFPVPTPSITPVGVFVHVAQITNFVTSAGTWPVYDVTTEVLTEQSITQGTNTPAGTQVPTPTPVPAPIPTPEPTPTPAPTPTPPSQSNTDAQNVSQFDAILIGGLDYRSSDLSIDRQEKLFKDGFGLTTNVKAFRYTVLIKTVKEFLVQNPKTPIFLFSAGCSKTLDLARDPNVDKKTLFVIEPFGVSANTKNLIEKAIAEGLPAENVYVGSYPGVGSTINGNTSKNPSSLSKHPLGSHWGSLEYVASLKSNLAQTRNVTPTPTPVPTPTPAPTPAPLPTPAAVPPTPVPTPANAPTPTTVPRPVPLVIIDDDEGPLVGN